MDMSGLKSTVDAAVNELYRLRAERDRLTTMLDNAAKTLQQVSDARDSWQRSSTHWKRKALNLEAKAGTLSEADAVAFNHHPRRFV